MTTRQWWIHFLLGDLLKPRHVYYSPNQLLCQFHIGRSWNVRVNSFTDTLTGIIKAEWIRIRRRSRAPIERNTELVTWRLMGQTILTSRFSRNLPSLSDSCSLSLSSSAYIRSPAIGSLFGRCHSYREWNQSIFSGIFLPFAAKKKSCCTKIK